LFKKLVQNLNILLGAEPGGAAKIPMDDALLKKEFSYHII